MGVNVNMWWALAVVLQLAVLQTYWPVTTAFNLDVGSAITHRGQPGSMFGFSVAQHRDSNVSWYVNCQSLNEFQDYPLRFKIQPEMPFANNLFFLLLALTNSRLLSLVSSKYTTQDEIRIG